MGIAFVKQVKYGSYVVVILGTITYHANHRKERYALIMRQTNIFLDEQYKNSLHANISWHKAIVLGSFHRRINYQKIALVEDELVHHNK